MSEYMSECEGEGEGECQLEFESASVRVGGRGLASETALG